jgi:hypothetical protein
MTKLTINNNKIEEKDAQQLADALSKKTVYFIEFHH